MNEATHGPAAMPDEVRAVHRTDWLKTVAIIMVVVNHFGYFFVEDFEWWCAFTAWAATVFFFLLGYARTRTVPFRWVWLGVLLTVLDSWNNDWEWMGPNILLSFALIRWARPHVQAFAVRHGWAAFALLVCSMIAVIPFASYVVEYGSVGWLWALFGCYQRMYVDDDTAIASSGATQDQNSPQRDLTRHARIMRVVACIVAATAFVWQEQLEYEFDQIQLACLAFTVAVVSLALLRFQRGPSRLQPPEPIACTLRFFGRHTLEIYAIQLAGSELIVLLFPHLAA